MKVEEILKSKGHWVETIEVDASIAEAVGRLNGPPQIGALVVCDEHEKRPIVGTRVLSMWTVRRWYHLAIAVIVRPASRASRMNGKANSTFCQVFADLSSTRIAVSGTPLSMRMPRNSYASLMWVWRFSPPVTMISGARLRW